MKPAQATDLLVDRIREVYPDVNPAPARLVEGQGQNNDVLILDERLVFRFPRSTAAAAGIERTAAVLRAVRRAGLPVPDPTYLAAGGPGGRRAFVGYPLLSGQSIQRETLDATGDVAALRRLGEQVGTFLRRLHAISVADVLPDDLARFDPTTRWQDLYARIRDRLFVHMRPDAMEAVARHFETFLADPATADIRPALVHGDFGTGNILHDPATTTLTGVIDFDGAGVGDPAVDFAALPWSPPAFFDGLVAAYPAIAGAPDRVAFYRGTFALQEALFGVEEGDGEAFRAGIAPFR